MRFGDVREWRTRRTDAVVHKKGETTMNLVRPSIHFLNATPEPLKAIELSGRTCYKSEDQITDDSAEIFVRKLLDRGHLAMIEHAWASYRVVCDRGVTHEIVRHRLFSYAQESTRYCNYEGGVTFIIPPWLQDGIREIVNLTSYQSAVDTGDILMARYWVHRLLDAEKAYIQLLRHHWTPQMARGVLPNALKTEIVITGNFRQWLHFFKLRTTKEAHPQMREVAGALLADVRKRVPVVFED